MDRKRLTLRNVVVMAICLAGISFFTSCDEQNDEQKSSEKQITAFVFTSPSATGVIDEMAKTIAVEVPTGTALTALVPAITVSEKARVNPASGMAQNFTTPATYTVTAEDGTTAVYTVTVTLATVNANDVYVGGIHNGRAVVWQNGNPTYLTAENGCIYSVVAANGHIYAAGNENGDAKLWKDGVEEHVLANGTWYDCAYSIAVSGTDVYVAGVVTVSAGKTEGRMWKNGVAQSGYANAQNLTSVFVVGSSVYVAGYTSANKSAVWKDGALLYTLTTGNNCYIYSVAVSGSNVYTTGYEWTGTKYIHKVWENNTERYTLATGLSECYITQLYLSGGNIYVAGYDLEPVKGRVPKLWVNGSVVNLICNIEGNNHAHSVFVLDGDIYVAGTAQNASKALLWINGGTPTEIVSGSSYAYSVFAVKKN